ncbi:hypothetical protein J5N58_08120 [Rhizobium cremeum]|uniref:hypothetical protein n=1 Tax=Rhizobium cremeum TaxID=2813827 RepID=UPI001FD41EAE|nr:hypothetical protein [Rhizobium cremeum]MCJ7995886.1 hypothetical protein [Rhizobium cremeum]MCJ7999641.1 hypothetical protein [Rhizobium cremeum]
MIRENEGRELLERLEDVVTSRIQQMASSDTDLTEADVQSLANHFTRTHTLASLSKA